MLVLAGLGWWSLGRGPGREDPHRPFQLILAAGAAVFRAVDDEGGGDDVADSAAIADADDTSVDGGDPADAIPETDSDDSLGRMLSGNFIEYASYVIKDRAIPDVDDGLKPVQRRILQLSRNFLEPGDVEDHMKAQVFPDNDEKDGVEGPFGIPHDSYLMTVQKNPGENRNIPTY